MATLTEKTLLISLIKDDLINTRLVNGLNALGLNGDGYLLHLSETILRLMGFEDQQRTEKLYNFYYELTARVKYLDISYSHEPLDELSHEIYEELVCIRTSAIIPIVYEEAPLKSIAQETPALYGVKAFEKSKRAMVAVTAYYKTAS